MEDSNGGDTNVGSIGNSIKNERSSIEETIKIIERKIKEAEHYTDITGLYLTLDKELCNAFINILSDYKRVLKENEELKFEERRRIIGKYGDAEIHDVINRTLSNDYIPVQKVKDNIKKLEIKKEKARGERDILERFAIEKSINSLQELLYGRNK